MKASDPLVNTNPEISKTIKQLQDTVVAMSDKYGLGVVLFVAEAKGTEPVEGEQHMLALKVQNTGITINNMTAPLALVMGHVLSHGKNAGLLNTLIMGAMGSRVEATELQADAMGDPASTSVN